MRSVRSVELLLGARPRGNTLDGSACFSPAIKIYCGVTVSSPLRPVILQPVFGDSVQTEKPFKRFVVHAAHWDLDRVWYMARVVWFTWSLRFLGCCHGQATAIRHAGDAIMAE